MSSSISSSDSPCACAARPIARTRSRSDSSGAFFILTECREISIAGFSIVPGLPWIRRNADKYAYLTSLKIYYKAELATASAPAQGRPQQHLRNHHRPRPPPEISAAPPPPRDQRRSVGARRQMTRHLVAHRPTSPRLGAPQQTIENGPA